MAQNIVIYFFCITVGIGAAGLAGIGGSFLVMMFRNLKSPECSDQEYVIFLKKGYTLRFCYGYCVFADILLTFAEISATALGTFIVLMKPLEPYLVVILLVTSFAASSLRGALNLKSNRIGYARAFRILEYAIDAYRLSEKSVEDKKKLHQANEKAQEIIEFFNE